MSSILQFYLAELIGPWAVRRPARAELGWTQVRLAKHGWHSFSHPQGMQIQCLRGNAVVTQEGDPRDQLLVAGESFTVTRPEHLCVQATLDCELRFTTPGAPESDPVHAAAQRLQPGAES